MREAAYYGSLGLAGPLALSEDFMVDILKMLLAWSERRELRPNEIALAKRIMAVLQAAHPELLSDAAVFRAEVTRLWRL